MNTSIKTIFLTTAITILTILPAAVSGFGKNKVQYQSMDWRQLHAPHYTVYYHQGQGTLPEITYELLNDIYRGLSGRFEYVHKSKVPVVIYESSPLFEQTNIITEILPEGVGGFTELFKNRVAMPFNGSLHDFRHVLHHEMVHAFVFGMIYDGRTLFRSPVQIPLWFNEGLAEVLSNGWNKADDMFMIDRAINSSIAPPGPFMNGYMAYKGGQSFLYYLYATEGDSLFNAMLRDFKTRKNAEKAIEHVYKKDMETLGREWILELRRLYWPEVGRRMQPSVNALEITNNVKEKSRVNIRPKISPDGRLIAFYSDKRDYMRIIIRDTSGKEIRQIGQHGFLGLGFGETIESFQAFNSGMCWSPDSDMLAFTVKRGGRNEIRIVDAKRGRNRRTIRLALSAINSLHWSKDGSKLTFTAISNGQTDLYMYGLTDSKLTRLTNSPHTESDPQFSPCGTKIIYSVLDTAGLGAKVFSNTPRSAYNIAIYDLEKKRNYILTNTPWNDKQPVWSPDGKHFMFVSDRNGIDNLYIASLDSPKDAKPLTDYIGTVANPDWSRDGSSVVFDLFLNQSWNIWRIENPLEKTMDEPLALTAWAQHELDNTAPFFKKTVTAAAARLAAANVNGVNDSTDVQISADIVDSVNIADSTDLTAADDSVDINDVSDSTDVQISATDIIDSVNTADSTDLTAADDSVDIIDIGDSTFAAAGFKHFIDAGDPPHPLPYRLRFTPDLVLFGLGISSYSGTSGQWLAMFSDIMGDHRISVMGDVQYNFDEYAHLYVTYHYLKYRLNAAVGGFYSKDYAYDGLFNRFYHDMQTGGFLGLSYPFSMFTRADLQFFGRHIERTALLRENSYTQSSQALLSTLAFSFDNILWGITGPLNGTRAQMRFHLSPQFDFVEEPYIAADADFRNYWHIAKKFVWANRLTFGGSFATDGDSPAARRFFLGGNDNWFNYGVNRKNYDNNLPYSFYSDIVSPLRGYKYFDVTGDRMVLMNSEFRFPFVREFSLVWPLPLAIRYVNGAIFTDAGYAWYAEDKTQSPWPSRLLCGIGYGMRANLGIFVLRYDRGWPTDWLNTGKGVHYFSIGAEF
ncbi:MAG: hypothetical protein FWE57_03775 [Chitinispirillia bacterium]|nr:hypothetical protein [Chitinispirillia bacterium]